MKPARVVITGIGIVAANGSGISSFTKSVRNGISGIRFFERLKDLNFLCQLGGIPDRPHHSLHSDFT